MTALLLALTLIGAPMVDTQHVDPASVPVRLAPGDSGYSGAIGAPAQAVHGWATYYPTCANCAAAGPAIARMFGGGRRYLGRWVTINGDTQHPVKLVTSCACGDRTIHGLTMPTVIDLSPTAFARVAPLSRGVTEVVIEPYSPALPATDTAPPAHWWGVAI